MNKIDYSNLGGFPLEQDTLDFMQLSYKGPLIALAKLCGNKSIVEGVEVVGGNVTPGWIVFNDELILFQGGVLGDDVVIAETPTSISFEDDSTHEAYFVKVAICGVGGAFPFADLVRLQGLQNMWVPGDIKEKYCDATYISTNFDGDGYGLNREAGWRILSKAYPAAAGKVMVNMDATDTDFNACGKNGGVKEVTLITDQIPEHSHAISRGDAYVGNAYAGDMRVGGGQGANAQSSPNTNLSGGGAPHTNMQPYFVVLKLIKL